MQAIIGTSGLYRSPRCSGSQPLSLGPVSSLPSPTSDHSELSSRAPLHLASEGPSLVPQKGAPLTFLCPDLSLEPGSHAPPGCMPCLRPVGAEGGR